ncbi:hypothetical protein [Algisphaera agarilytica]|uniref:Uncharacterized protein n=1 Tax=Algisphaera agarilytica TaxID=1385975 RepID=A0A7X0H743_9BACT|nr:hypothetical protein [Algisphaera agarilytica]MBB6430459.1 hypothetical protein [Algisphaera agarilytica]
MLFRITDQSTIQTGRHPGLGRLGHQLSDLRAVVLLAGSVRANQLRKATGRSALEMPVGSNRSVLDCWREQLVTMAEQLGIANLPVRVMVDQASGMTPGVTQHGPVQLSIEIDPGEFRGTGGLLSDIAREYRDDDLILVTHASQLLFEPLAELSGAMAEVHADVSMICSANGTPSGLMLMRCGCLRDINPVGFVDLNEQALPSIAESHDVRVVRYDQPTSRSLRTLPAYLETLREYHRRQAGPNDNSPHREDWEKTFGIVEPGARVHETAIIHDSVILSGARVEAHAVLVRSVVCPGVLVARDQSEVDCVVGARVNGNHFVLPAQS